MKRITYADVKAAMEKTGLGVTQGCFHVNYDGCTCPIGHLYIAETGGENDDPSASIRWARDAYNEDYVSGFWVGFDGIPFDWIQDYTLYTAAKMGYDDGVEVRRLLIEDGVELG